MKKAFITGITGQDGAWLSKILLDRGYEVYGGMRRTSTFNTWRLDFLGIKNEIKLVDFDLLDYTNIYNVIEEVSPDEFYNLAAQSFVGVSFKQPISTYHVNAQGVAYILDILKTFSPKTKFYQASTSEMFGSAATYPLNERSPFHPRSPYGVAKLFSHWLTVNYRDAHNMFCCSGILFNHESELRGSEFVTKKISFHIAAKHLGWEGWPVLKLGNLDAVRDWGYAKEYCEAMYLMMQQSKPDNYVISTGDACTVRKFVEMAFKVIDKEIHWEGAGVNEIGYDSKTSEILVEIDPQFYRPAEVDVLIGDSLKAEMELGWKAKTRIADLAKLMVESDIKRNTVISYNPSTNS